MSKKLTTLIFCSLIVLSGCQTVQQKEQTANFDQLYHQGAYSQASSVALQNAGVDKDGKSNDLLWSLQAGTALSSANQHSQSIALLDSAESFMKIEDLESLLKKGGEQVTAALLNNTFNDYDPTVYDGVMVNTIKAFNFFKLKDYQNARIEFNRAAERQRLAEEFFSQRIAELEEKKQQEQNRKSFDQNMTTSQNVVDDNFAELQAWEVYPDFVNPYTDYIHSLFFLLTGSSSADFGKARDSIRRVAGMVPDNAFVQTDLKVIDNVAKGRWKRDNLNPVVWVIFENGLAPMVEEIVIPLPLVLVTNKVDYMQLALPKLKERDIAYPYLEVSADNNIKEKTVQLASMERVIQTEFKKEYSYRVTQALMSTIVKGLIQHELQKKGGMASLIGAIYQVATTHADTRSWTALPKEFQMARLRKPDSGKLHITAPGYAGSLSVELPEGQFAIVHVKATTDKSGLSYDVIKL